MSVGPVKLWHFLEELCDSILDEIFVTEASVADSVAEKFIKIKLILHEELDAACVKLHNLLVHNLRIRPCIEIKRTHAVLVGLIVPFERGDTNLEGIHSLTIMLQLLVLVFDCIIIVLSVVETNCEPRELSIKRDKISRVNTGSDQWKLLHKIMLCYIHDG